MWAEIPMLRTLASSRASFPWVSRNASMWAGGDWVAPGRGMNRSRYGTSPGRFGFGTGPAIHEAGRGNSPSRIGSGKRTPARRSNGEGTRAGRGRCARGLRGTDGRPDILSRLPGRHKRIRALRFHPMAGSQGRGFTTKSQRAPGRHKDRWRGSLCVFPGALCDFVVNPLPGKISEIFAVPPRIASNNRPLHAFSPSRRLTPGRLHG